MNLDRSRQVTALTLLDAFCRCFPNDTEKSVPDEDSLRHCPSALFRLQQLKALFAAFEIPLDPERFSSGRFILYREEPSTTLLAQLFANPPETLYESLSSNDLRILFKLLRDYRQGMARGRESFGVIFCWPSIIGHTMTEVITPINNDVERIMAPIDAMLATLISPNGKTFTIGELIDHYGYPDVDVEDLQWDETWGNPFGKDDEQ